MALRLTKWLAATALGLVTSPLQPLYACSCIGISPQTALHLSNLAFAGTAFERKLLHDGPTNSSLDTTEYRFVVTHVWKGAPGDTIAVWTIGSSACGFDFRLGEHYLVFAGDDNGHVWTGQCSRNGMSRYALWDLMALPVPAVVGGAPALAVPTVETLLDSLGSVSPMMRWAASEALGGYKERRHEILLQLISIIRGRRSGDARAAIVALGQDAKYAKADLVWALRKAAPDARWLALRRLRRLEEPKVFWRHVEQALRDRSSEVVREALYMVDEPHDSTNKKPLARIGRRLPRLLTHPDAGVRLDAIRILDRHYPERETELLRVLRRMITLDPNHTVRRVAREVLLEHHEIYP